MSNEYLDKMDERRAVTGAHILALLEMQLYPTAHTQRIVEHLSFLPGGGQQWRRDVQVRLPTGTGVPADDPFIVSLGMMKRSRFADFCVRDEGGRKLMLLTRFQHGYCLATCFIFKFLSEPQIVAVESDPEKYDYDSLHRLVYAMFTSVDRGGQPQVSIAKRDAMGAARALAKLLRQLDAPAREIQAKVVKFVEEFVPLTGVTQYLCWVPGSDGATVSLSATYTMADAPLLERRRAAPNARERLRMLRTDAYARSGLGPVRYELRTPIHDHAGSYYFMVQPPEDTRVTYLDWAIDNTIDNTTAEVDCAYQSVHIFNGGRLSPIDDESPPPRNSISGSTVRAFLRADPRDHWPLMLGAMLNILLALMAERGKFVSDASGGVGTILLITPTALLAFIAQQQKHYYAAITGWLARLMWLYLLVNIVFIVSVKYDIVSGDSAFSRSDILDDLVSAGVAIASATVVGWFLAIGFNDRAIRRQFRRSAKWGSSSWVMALLIQGRNRAVGREPGRIAVRLLSPILGWVRGKYRWLVGALPPGASRMDLYVVLGRRYGDRVARRIAIGVLLILMWMVIGDWGAGRSAAVDAKADPASNASAQVQLTARGPSPFTANTTTSVLFGPRFLP
ncbi:MAG: hypothetical protein ABW167_20755 [Baekduia sp.]